LVERTFYNARLVAGALIATIQTLKF
jgi:hypothetical protein